MKATTLARRNTQLPLENSIDSLFDDLFEGFSLIPLKGVASNLEPAFNPRINVSEDKKEIKISAELPGIDESDVSVELDEEAITISGEKKTETEEKDECRYHIEQHYGSFKRVIPLSTKIDGDKVKAEYKKGILSIRLPKLPDEKPRTKKIAIKAA